MGDSPSDEAVEHWLDYLRADQPEMEVVFPTTSEPAWPTNWPVATASGISGRVNTGAEVMPAWFIADVVVLPTHKRRGLMRALMTNTLTSARDQGYPVAALTATSGELYGRFGFGVATRAYSMELDLKQPPVFLRQDDGRVEIVRAADIAQQRQDVYEQVLARYRGAHHRLSFMEPHLSGAWDYDKHQVARNRRSAIHYDAQGRVDGVLTYVPDSPTKTVKVLDLLAANAAAELALWQHLASIELIEKVTYNNCNPASALPWALANPYQVCRTKQSEFTWLRIIDLAAALEWRGYEATGSVEFSVTDPMQWLTGGWRVDVSDDGASVTKLTETPELTVPIAALGSMYFGLASAKQLHAAGSITGPGDHVARLDRLFRTSQPPYCQSHF